MLTSYDPQLSDPWHANQNRAHVTDVHLVAVLIAVVPMGCVHSRSINVNQPRPQSQRLMYLKIFPPPHKVLLINM